jgi:hypothetical protein
MANEIMKTIIFSIIYLFLIVLGIAQQIPIESLYLGQTPPGRTPKIINLPIISGSFTGERIAISSDGKNIYYNEFKANAKPRIKCLRYESNKWAGPFNLFDGYCSPGLSITGDTIFIESGQSFYSVKKDTGWGTPKRFLPKVNFAHYLEVTNSGSFYVTSAPNIGSRGDISRVLFNDSNITLQSLPYPINSSLNGIDFYIAKDESYIIFPRIIDGAGDLYVSYKKTDTSWTDPKSLGSPINTPDWECSPFVSPDNKYLFFVRSSRINGNSIYWVKIDDLIDSLRQTGFVPK